MRAKRVVGADGEERWHVRYVGEAWDAASIGKTWEEAYWLAVKRRADGVGKPGL